MLRGLLEALINLVFPAKAGCQLCGRPGNQVICTQCQEWLTAWGHIPKCQICGRPLHTANQFKARCYDCHHKLPSFKLARAVGPYEGCLREAVHLLKYQGRKALAPLLGGLILEVVKQEPELRNCQLVLPVPISPGRLRERGFNQAELLAKEVAQGLKLTIYTDVLIKPVETPHQTGLSKEARQVNLDGAFRVKGTQRIKGKQILLVDDVFTTGSTVAKLADLLIREGAGKVMVITVVNAAK